MAYTRFLGKRVIAGSKYVVGYAEPPALFEGWTNVSWDTFISSGDNITSAISSGGKFSYAETNFVPLVPGDIIRIHVTDFNINYGIYSPNTAEFHLIHHIGGLIATYTIGPWVPHDYDISISMAANYALRFQNYNKTAGNQCDVDIKMHIYKKLN